METIEKTQEKISVVSDINVSLANAIRRSVNEIPVLAIDEADVYKNDSALYDEIIVHRLGLIPLKNQKMKVGQDIEMKFKVKGKGERTEVLSGELGDQAVYQDMPIVILSEGQEIEIVARARAGLGINHAKFSPGILFYKHLPKIKISGESEKQSELAEIYPEAFEMFGEKLKVKNAAEFDLETADLKDYPGIEVSYGDDLVLTVESWGQMDAKDVFVEACKALKGNLSEVSKVLK
ncbi:MAG: DNA-directed RNA polymerase subunit D [Nanoarchaeota archaeon]|nr:DNA-directed RNA polymerase subunit D [Nanoarchaeota archaeon]